VIFVGFFGRRERATLSLLLCFFSLASRAWWPHLHAVCFFFRPLIYTHLNVSIQLLTDRTD
jgi:hypothetical protein